MWGEDERPVILPKTRDSGIMVSNFIDEHNGYLRLMKSPKVQSKPIQVWSKMQEWYLSMGHGGMDTGQEINF